MRGFRSRAKKPTDAAVVAPAVAHEMQQTNFRVGDHVKTMVELQSFPAGCSGEVTYIRDDEGERSYEVMLENIGFKITATAGHLELIAPYDPNVFTVGTRVRLTQDFAGFLWDENIATESEDAKGKSVAYRAGTTCLIKMQPPAGIDEYIVSPDYDQMSLAVRASKLERIPGRTRVVTNSDGGIRIQQLFNCKDAVRLRNNFTSEDGGIYEEGWLGYVHPMEVDITVLQGMEKSWHTGIYTVCLSNDPSGRDRGFIDVPASALQLNSDFYPSPYK